MWYSNQDRLYVGYKTSFNKFKRLGKKRTQINKPRNERGDITIDITEIQRIRLYYEQLYATNLTTSKKLINS